MLGRPSLPRCCRPLSSASGSVGPDRWHKFFWIIIVVIIIVIIVIKSHNCDHQNTIRILAATSPASVTIDGVVKLRMEEEGMGARPPISCYSTIRCMLMVMFGSAITIIIMIVLIINGCTSSSSGTLWINSRGNLHGWIICRESGRKYLFNFK